MGAGVLFFDLAAVGFIVALSLYVIAQSLESCQIRRIARIGFIAAFLIETFGFILRWIAAGRFPITNTYEALLFYGWVLSLAYLILLFTGIVPKRIRAMLEIGISFLATIFLVVAGSPLRNPALVPLVPILRSHWLAFHVGFVFVGEGFFTVAFVAAVIRVSVGRKRKPNNTNLQLHLDTLIQRSISIGFPFFTLGGLLFGAIWAKHAWGRYWGWDPKETFLLVTWVVYVVYLATGFMRNWSSVRRAWIAIVGYLLAVFTFIGVNFLMYGLHSYR